MSIIVVYARVSRLLCYNFSMKQRLIRFLRYTERFTKTDMVYLAHGGFWLSTAQLIASASGFLLTIVFANLLSPEVFGEYRFLMSGFLILSIFALPGMRNAVMESTPKNFAGNLKPAIEQMLRFGCIGSVFALSTAAYYYLQGDISLALGFITIALALPFFDSTSVYLDYLKALKEFKKVSLYSFLTRVFLLFGTGLIAYTTPEHAWLIFAGFLMGNIIPGVYFSLKTLKKTLSEKQDVNLLHYAKHLTIISAFGLFAAQFDKVLIWNMIGAEDLAIFYIAYAIPQEALRFLNIVPQLAFPKFATTSTQILKQTLPKKIIIFFLISTTLAILYVLASPLIFSFLFPQYIEAIPYSQVLIFTALWGAFSPIYTALIAKKNTKALYIYSLLNPILRLTTLVLFVNFIGIWGAVIALFFEAICRTLLLLYFLYKL